MVDFLKIAQEATALSPVMVGRTKLETEDILNQELTIIEFGFAPKFNKDGTPCVNPHTGEVDTFGVVIFAEKPDQYYCVGTVCTRVCKMWVSAFETAEEASAELAANGGVRARFTQTRTKKGNNLTNVEFLR